MIGLAVGRVGGWFGNDAPAAPGVALDDALDVLRNERRRLVVRYVAGMPISDHEAVRVRVRDLSEVLAAQEAGCTLEAVSRSAAKSMYVSLIQTHLPQLDAVGVLDYDEERKTVGREPTVEAFAELLDSGAELFDSSEERGNHV